MHQLTRYAAALPLMGAVLLPGIVSAQSVGPLQAEINSLLVEVQQLEAQLAGQGGSTASWCHTFTTNLSIGMSGSAVTALQMALQKDGQSVSVTGTFDDQTASAVTGFQEKYASQILTPNGLRHGTGYAGKSTRAELNVLFGCNNLNPNPTATPTSSSQPVITSITPSSGPVGMVVTIKGSGFVPPTVFTGTVAANVVSFNGWAIAGRASGDGDELTFTIPSMGHSSSCSLGGPACPVPETPVTPGTYQLTVITSGGTSNAVPFTVTANSTSNQPHISSITPSSGPIGTLVTVAGSGFTSTNNLIYFSNYSPIPLQTVVATATSDNGHTLQFVIPSSTAAFAGPSFNYAVTVVNSNGDSNTASFTVTGGTTPI